MVDIAVVLQALIAESGDHAVATGAGMAVWTASGGGPGVGGDGVVDAWLAARLVVLV